jgi:hypothetical protein
MLILSFFAAAHQQALGFADLLNIDVSDQAADSQSTAKRICDAISRQLISPTGPMGLGVFARSKCTLSSIKNDPSKEKVKNSSGWRLRIDQTNEKLVFTLGLAAESKNYNQASLNLSGFSSSVELLGALEDPRLAWLISIALLDQLPVMGRVNGRLTKTSKGNYTATTGNDPEKIGIKLTYELVPVRIVFQAKSELWNVTAVATSDAHQQQDSPNPDWLANTQGRSENQQEIVSRIDELISSLKEEAKRQAESAAAKAAAEEQKKEESQWIFPRLPDLPESYWADLAIAWSRIPNLQLRGLNSRLVIGSETKYFRWIELYGQFDRTVFEAEYISTDDDVTKKTSQLVLTELIAGLGTSGRYDLDFNTWIRAGAYLNHRSQNVLSAGSTPTDFDFQNLEQDTLFGLLLKGSLNTLNGPLLSGVALELESLVPQFRQYSRAAAEVSSLYLLTRTPGTGKTEAETNTVDFRLGPFLRADLLFINRTFPTPTGDTQNTSAAIKINIINFPMGLIAHVAF